MNSKLKDKVAELVVSFSEALEFECEKLYRPDKIEIAVATAYGDIGILVAEAAQEIFEKCGAADDFCVQAVGSGCAVFGGTNRVIFNPLSGFKADAGHCTARFLAAFDEHYK